MWIRDASLELAHLYNPAYIRASHDEIRRLVNMGYRPLIAVDIVCDSYEMV